MTGLIYKDFLALKGHLTTYLVFFLVYGGLCLSGVFTASVLCGSSLAMSHPSRLFRALCADMYADSADDFVLVQIHVQLCVAQRADGLMPADLAAVDLDAVLSLQLLRHLLGRHGRCSRS